MNLGRIKDFNEYVYNLLNLKPDKSKNTVGCNVGGDSWWLTGLPGQKDGPSSPPLITLAPSRGGTSINPQPSIIPSTSKVVLNLRWMNEWERKSGQNKARKRGAKKNGEQRGKWITTGSDL